MLTSLSGRQPILNSELFLFAVVFLVIHVQLFPGFRRVKPEQFTHRDHFKSPDLQFRNKLFNKLRVPLFCMEQQNTAVLYFLQYFLFFSIL